MTSNGCGKKFSIKNDLSYPKGGLVLEPNYDAAKEGGALGDRSLIPSAISHEPKIYSRTLHRERNRSGERQERGTAKRGAEILGESQGGGVSGRTVNGAAALARRT